MSAHRAPSPDHSAGLSASLPTCLHLTGLTMDDEVHLSGIGLVAGLEGAGVEALVTKPHLGDED